MAADSQELLERRRVRRDAGAFSELVSRHADMANATCRRILGSSTDAEDVCQECFLKLGRHPASVRVSVGDGFTGWQRIAR